MKNRGPERIMTTGEIAGGFCYLPFYLVLWSLILPAVFSLLGLEVTTISINLAYFYINFLFIVVIFHRTLAVSLKDIVHSFWPFVQALILGFALYYAGVILLNLLLYALVPDLSNPNDETVSSMAETAYYATIVCSVLLGPLVEETLVRGLIFGNVHRWNRIAAYIISILFFCFMHLWQYAWTTPLTTLLLSALQYLPAGIALGWVYEKSGNIWCPIVLHMILNGITMSVL